MTGEAEAPRAAIYQLPAADLVRSLPDIGEGLHAQLLDLHRELTPERCERLALNLDVARRSVLTLRERLLAEGAGDGR